MKHLCTIVGFDADCHTINLRVSPMPKMIEIGGQLTIELGTSPEPSAFPVAHNANCDVWGYNPEGMKEWFEEVPEEQRPTDPCVVCDVFAGSGTTGQVALELGRRAILIELNPKYVQLIQERCHITPGLPL